MSNPVLTPELRAELEQVRKGVRPHCGTNSIFARAILAIAEHLERATPQVERQFIVQGSLQRANGPSAPDAPAEVGPVRFAVPDTTIPLVDPALFTGTSAPTQAELAAHGAAEYRRGLGDAAARCDQLTHWYGVELYRPTKRGCAEAIRALAQQQEAKHG